MTISPLFSPSEPPPSHAHIRERKREFQVKGGKREFRFIPHLLPLTFLSVQFLNGWVVFFSFSFFVSYQLPLGWVRLNLHSVLLELLFLTGPGVSTGRRGWARAWYGWAPARASGWRGSAAALAIDGGVGGVQALPRGEPAGSKRPRQPLLRQRPTGWAEAPRPKLW